MDPRTLPASSLADHDLGRRHPLRPIRSDPELHEAIDFLNSLPLCEHLSAEEEDDKLVLPDLIRRYETDNDPQPKLQRDEMLRALIDARGINQATLASDLGISESKVSEILAGKRGVSLRNRRLFAEYFRVDPGVFV